MEAKEIRAVAVAACGIGDFASVCAVHNWFAHYSLQQFAEAEEHLKRRCGMVTPGMKGEVACLLWQAHGCLGLNQHESAMHRCKFDLFRLEFSSPKAELMRRPINL